MTRTSRISRTIKAGPAAVWAAFMDPQALVKWLPPARMTGQVHAFDGRVGGGYGMSLFYPENERIHRGKTTEREDRVQVRFVELQPPSRIVETIGFATDDPALRGEMTMTATFESVPEGTRVVMLFENLPPGLKPEDNDEGGRLSLEQLARLLES